MVTKVLTMSDIRTSPKAIVALDKEWQRLVSKDTFDLKSVRSWIDVAKEAYAANEKAHVGLAFGIAGINHHELPEDDPFRVYKGRYVFQGRNVRDENNDYAIFQNLGSSPASLEASKAVDAWGLMPGHATEQSDAEQANIQCDLGGDVTTFGSNTS